MNDAGLLLLKLSLFAAERGQDIGDTVRAFKEQHPELFDSEPAPREYHFIYCTDREDL